MKARIKILRWSCDSCKTVVDVRDHAVDIRTLLEGYEEDPVGFKCGVCGGSIRRSPHARVDSDEVIGMTMTSQEFWRWSHYVLHVEKEKDLQWVTSVAVGSEITGLDLRADQGRCVIDSVMLKNGIKLCLGASGLGAIVERVERNGRKYQWPSNGPDSEGRNDPKSEPAVEGGRDSREGLPGSGPESEASRA